MSLEAIKSEMNKLIDKARSDFLIRLKDDQNWDWVFSSKGEDGSIWIESKDKKYTAYLQADGDLIVRFSEHTLFREEAPARINRLIALFTRQPLIEPTSLAKRLKEVDAAIEARRNMEHMERQLRWAKEAFEK